MFALSKTNCNEKTNKNKTKRGLPTLEKLQSRDLRENRK